MRIERHQVNGVEEARAKARGLRQATAPDPDIDIEAARIVAAVRELGDAELQRLSSRFEATNLAPGDIKVAVDPAGFRRALAAIDPQLAAALRLAAFNIAEVAEADLASRGRAEATLPQGQRVSIIERPVESAGIYVPGGGGAYPSSLLMGAVTAKAAGVPKVVVVTPAGPDGTVPDIVLAAAEVAGVDALYATGGAQAVAALAYGTESVPAVDVIAGPGSPWVNAAKKAVMGDVGIDGIAGPSELVVIADTAADPRAVALDLLAQAEHGEGGLICLAATDGAILDAVAAHLETFGTEHSLAANPTALHLVEVAAPGDALELADTIAPEHLQLCIADAAEHADRVAGCVFLGPLGATAFGDYSAGSNHVLPTGGAARYGGPLGVGTFLRRTSVVDITADAARALADPTAALADAEGFSMHAESVRARRDP